MTRGKWTSGGKAIDMKDMATGHLMNSIRYLARKYRAAGNNKFELLQCEIKMSELAEEAQTRRLLPTPLDFDSLLVSALSWPTRKDADESMAVIIPAGLPVALPPPLPVASFAPGEVAIVIPLMSRYIDVVRHAEELNADLLLENRPVFENRVLTFDEL